MKAGFFMADINLNEPVDAAKAMRANSANLLTGQDTRTNNFLNKFTDVINSQGTTSALADRIGNEIGLPTLRANSQSLNNTLFQLPQTYSAATRGFDVNANQLSRIIGQKQSEIAPAAALAQSNTQNAENTLNTRLGYAKDDWNRQLLPLNSEQNFLTDRMARETSLYTQDNQNELNAIIQKVQNGITLSEGEKNRAQQLAIAEKGYENALKVATSNNQPAKTSPFMTVGEGSSIFNTSTGQQVYTAPKTYAPGTGTSGTNNYLPPQSTFNWGQYGL